jgi:hypothetical protein
MQTNTLDVRFEQLNRRNVDQPMGAAMAENQSVATNIKKQLKGAALHQLFAYCLPILPPKQKVPESNGTNLREDSFSSNR